jgi:hypothetical protein
MAPSRRKSMGTNDLRVSLSCGCGRSVVARAKDAGGTISCICGKQVAVPRLSELRTRVGADAYVTNPAEAIRKLQEQGISPAGDRCLLCKSMATVAYTCHALCETTYSKPDDSALDEIPMPMLAIAFDYLVVEPLYRILFRRGGPNSTVVGYDVGVTFTLPVCDACAKTSGNVIRPKIAKRLMASVPVLAELLAYYPQLELTVERPVS